jgi:Glycosyl hydrolase family 65 central catalytic domain
MTTKIKTFILFLIISFHLYSQESNQSQIAIVSGKGNQKPYGYVPPLTSNGSLSLIVDYQGNQTQNNYYKMIPGVFKAGRRIGPPLDDMIPFGHFEMELSVNGKTLKEPDSWTQTLNKKDAFIRSVNNYSNGLVVESEVFTYIHSDVVLVKKIFKNTSNTTLNIAASFQYSFTPAGNENKLPRRVISQTIKNEKTNSIDFVYEADAYKPYKGITSILSDKAVVYGIDRQKASLKSEYSIAKNASTEITYYIVINDSMEDEDYIQKHNSTIDEVRKAGFKGLLALHTDYWNSFFDKSYVKLPEPKLEAVYNTSMYHLRANATKWSFPIGIFPSHWGGRYFGWDETFAFFGLVSANHLEISKRVPDFRLSVMKHAMDRAKHTSMTDLNKRFYGAKFPWETLEDGWEGCPFPGFWVEHVFHMAHIAMAAWMQYEYSGDKDFLKNTAYPLIRECNRYFNVTNVYENQDGTLYIGKVTDLERLGPARENAFLTTAGVIHTMEIAAKSADILGETNSETEHWKVVAAKLRETLPSNGQRYIPYPGCKEESIGTLGGLCPYPIFDKTNDLQRNAAYWFQDKGLAFGNVTTKGDSIGSWYAAKLATSFARLEDRKQTVHWLRKTTSGSGCFGELFEIHEPKFSSFPWYAAVGGTYIYATNQMLIQSKENSIAIAPAVPDTWNDFSFKLGCYNNLVAEVIVNKGKINQLNFTTTTPGLQVEREITIPKRFFNKKLLNKKLSVKVEELPDAVILKVKVSNNTNLFSAK